MWGETLIYGPAIEVVRLSNALESYDDRRVANMYPSSQRGVRVLPRKHHVRADDNFAETFGCRSCPNYNFVLPASCDGVVVE